MVKLLSTRVTGEAYYDAHLSLPTLRESDPLLLDREPDNSHDKHAIAVRDAEGRKLGYVQRSDNKALAGMMDAGELFVAEVSGLDRERWDIRLDVLWLRVESL